MVVKIIFIKLGNITLTTLVDIMLDERASRKDIEVDVISSSTKMKETDADRIIKKLRAEEGDLFVLVCPNANSDGPKKVIEAISKSNKLIVISDAAEKDLRKYWKEKGIGYIILPFDPMIGAKKDFLDPSEMGLFNGYTISAFSACGVFEYVTSLIDEAIMEIKEGKNPSLPYKYPSALTIVKNYPFKNDYSKAKALATLELLKLAGKTDVKACFGTKDNDEALLLAASAHEMVRLAGLLADEIREMEKNTNQLVRMPHSKEGKRLYKEKFFEGAK